MKLFFHWLKKVVGNLSFGAKTSWRSHVFYFPVYLYGAILSLRARSFLYFANVNPFIWFSGLYGESKWQIYCLLPKEYLPETYFIPVGMNHKGVCALMLRKQLSYPVVLKPDIGLQGRRVDVVYNEEQLASYLAESNEPLILQNYIDYPLELGVMYYRLPGEKQGRISSLVIKELPLLRGDGKHSLQDLLKKNPESEQYITRQYAEYMRQEDPEWLNKVLAPGEPFHVSMIGNHARGARFIDICDQIVPEMNTFFEKLSRKIPGFHYGRYDIKCASLDDLAQGKHVKIIELNGISAEAAHIYDVKHGLMRKYKDIFAHMQVICRIAIANKRLGFPFPHFEEGFHFFRVLFGGPKHRVQP